MKLAGTLAVAGGLFALVAFGQEVPGFLAADVHVTAKTPNLRPRSPAGQAGWKWIGSTFMRSCLAGLASLDLPKHHHDAIRGAAARPDP
jgi:hypothetical protein